ncbi:MAG TPA: hypothetical protein VHO70_06105 [Chitinispirillaceae bacterium]|nr:hypothetical protein [Chitinispirillaceae bacterium]
MRSFSVLALIIALSFSSFAQVDNSSSKGSSNGSSSGDGSYQIPDAFFVGAGPGVLDNLKAENWSVQFFGGKQWALNKFFAPKAVLEATTDFSESVITSALVGANVYPIAKAISPYVGLGTGVGYAKSADDRDVFGFDMAGSFGLLMFRGAALELNLETNANFIFRDIGSDDGMPMSFSARVGVLF